jgi:flagellar export protein FliJ
MVFQFRLDPVIDQRKRKTEALEIEHAELVRLEVECRDGISALQQRIDGQRELMAGQQKGGPIDLEFMRGALAYIDWLDKKIEEERRKLREISKNVEAKRGELLQSMRDQRSIEKLRENALERAVQHEKYVEQRDAEEMANVGYNTRRASA